MTKKQIEDVQEEGVVKVLSFDGPGVNHEPFTPGGKAEAMYNNLCSQEQVPLLVPFDPGENPRLTANSVYPVQLNGLRLNIRKGMYVKVPRQIAETVMESLNQTTAIPLNVQTRNPYSGEIVDANLSTRDEKTKEALSA